MTYAHCYKVSAHKTKTKLQSRRKTHNTRLQCQCINEIKTTNNQEEKRIAGTHRTPKPVYLNLTRHLT